MSNVATRARVRANLSAEVKEIIRIARSGASNISSADFPQSPLFDVAHIDHELHKLHISRTEVIQNIQPLQRGKRISVQNAFYELVIQNWKWYNQQALREHNKGDIVNVIRMHAESKYHFARAEAHRLAKKWVLNYKSVARLILPRSSACLLRAGLHGWFTSHRFGETRCCHFCQSDRDSLFHLSKCPVVKQIWGRVFGTTLPEGMPFNKATLLGFTYEDHSIERRVHACSFLFLIYEAHRYFRHHGVPPTAQTSIGMCRTVLTHATGCFVGSRCKHEQSFVHKCRDALLMRS